MTRTEYIPVAPQVDGVEILMPIAYAPVARTSEDCDLFNVIVVEISQWAEAKITFCATPLNIGTWQSEERQQIILFTFE